MGGALTARDPATLSRGPSSSRRARAFNLDHPFLIAARKGSHLPPPGSGLVVFRARSAVPQARRLQVSVPPLPRSALAGAPSGAPTARDIGWGNWSSGREELGGEGSRRRTVDFIDPLIEGPEATGFVASYRSCV